MKKQLLSFFGLATSLVSTSALATNGMMLEGYGARATALGGAGIAIDNGNSNAMTNPANLSLMEENSQRFGIGLRALGPKVNSAVPGFGISSNSEGTAYYMPSISYMRKDNGISYGAAILAHGGMGTEYGNSSALFAGGFNSVGGLTALSGENIRSEVGVGSLMFPISVQVNDRLRVGGSIDFVWASMDLQMDMDGTQFANLYGGNGGSIGGSMRPIMGAVLGGTTLNWGRFNFSDGSDFTGEATATGWDGKIGLAFDVNDRLTLGLTYRSKTFLDDMTTHNATMQMNTTAYGTTTMKGDLKVVDFEWPEQYGIGAAFKANDKLTLVGEVKYIGWADVMDSFKMHFTPNSTSTPIPGLVGSTLEVTMDQKWDDQIVYSMGAEYEATPKVTLRAGLNLSDNPIPNDFVNPLFPAIVKNHVTGGFGYKISDNSKVGMSFTYAPKVKVTGSGALNNGVEIAHSQFNWALNYAYSF